MTNDQRIEKAFDDYERNTVRLPDTLNKQAQRVHPRIRGAAEKAFPGETTSWLSGSYGRKTQAGPVLKDIDIIIEFDDVDELLEAPPSMFLARVAAAVEECELVLRADPRRRAVESTLIAYEFTADVVPGIRHSDGTRLYLANVSAKDGKDEWQLLNPRGQLEAAQSKNAATGGLYIRIVRVIKFWNQQFGKNNTPLRSYHAEALVFHSISDAAGFVDAVVSFFDHAYEMLAPGALTPDPGDPGQDVDELLEDADRARARAIVADACEKAHEAALLGDADEAAEIWGTIFPGFPSPGMSSAKVRSALGTGIGITGTGINPAEPGRERIKGRSWRPR